MKCVIIRGLPCLILLLALVGRTLSAATRAQGSVYVLASGETHAMLRPCDCPDAPGGGLAERAALVDEIRDSAAVLLLDAGGFAGGGIYDTYSEGRRNDSVRTVATIKAMGEMGYDVAVAGDDDLQYGGEWLADQAERAGLVLVCANCETEDGRSIFPPYRIVQRNGITFAVTGVTTQERMFRTDSTVRVRKPISALREVLGRMAKESDYQIVLSHLGEAASGMLADSLDEIDMVINGHRKGSNAPVVRVADVPVVQFGYQGKALAQVRVEKREGGPVMQGATWEPVDGMYGASAAVTALLDSTESDRGTPPYDLYIMSQCPYGLEALAEFLRFVRRLPGAEWNLWFVGTVGDNGMRSLHGPGEIADEKLWLAVRELHPQQWLEFLEARVEESASTLEVAARLGLDTAAMRAWTVQHGDQQLAMHYRRSMRLGIDASPTLTRANSPLSLEPTAQRLTWEACHGPYEGAPACDSLPVCIDDRDCRRAGKLGRCVSDEGRPACVYRDAVRFECVVVGPGTEAGPDEQSIVAGTQELFPGVSITRVSFETRRGKKLVADAGVDALPLYLFGRAVEDAANFGRIRDDVRRVGKYYTFGDGVVPQTYFHRRPLQPGNVQVFIDPLFAAVDEVLREALGVQDSVAVHPVLYTNPSAPTGSAEERFRAEEAQRWLLLRKHFPEAYRTYLASYAKRPGSTYWTTSLAEAGVDIEDFTRIAEQDTSALDDAWRLLRELDIRTPVMMLVDNRHLMPVDNLRQLTRALNRRPRG